MDMALLGHRRFTHAQKFETRLSSAEWVHSEDLPANGRRVHSKITSDRFDVVT